LPPVGADLFNFCVFGIHARSRAASFGAGGRVSRLHEFPSVSIFTRSDGKVTQP
jgi:hypothetical protein